jgi:predicted dehydrogenase
LVDCRQDDEEEETRMSETTSGGAAAAGGGGGGGRQGGGQVRWGILGAASIARGQFLPALRETGDGRAAIVGSRDRRRGEAFAAAEGVDRVVDGYEAVLASEIDAVYIALPNSHHARWTIAAIEAGLHVLCEKPLCASVGDTETVLTAAREHPDAPLWEAFVFPFQAQHRRLLQLLGDGAIGDPAELHSGFHFRLARPDNIRFSAELGGGALADVGCYPIALGHELFGRADGRTAATGLIEGEVDVEAAGVVEHGAHRRLLLSCGFRRPFDTFTRVLGDGGELRLTNPFHPGADDVLELHRPEGDPIVERPTTDAHSFTAALRHIHAVVRQQEAPRQLAIDSALPNARTLAALQAEVAR